MRKKTRKQIPLMVVGVNHAHAEELDGIRQFLDRNPIIYEMALQDLTHNVNNPGTGAEGMTAEQVVRAAIVKRRQACPGITHLRVEDIKAYQSIFRITRGRDIAVQPGTRGSEQEKS